MNKTKPQKERKKEKKKNYVASLLSAGDRK
jgi:hypothetical protein